jgi:xylose dehydrogenase (NAD/NADP)
LIRSPCLSHLCYATVYSIALKLPTCHICNPMSIFTMYAAECDEMITACQKAHVVLMEAVMYRFHPRMRYLKQMLVANELGDVRFLHAAFSFNFNAPGNYRAYKQFGGGALLDVGCYCVNAARWLIGSEPESSRAIISYNQESIDLNINAILRFSEDVSAHIQSSFMAAEHQVIEVVGTTGLDMLRGIEIA